MSKKSFEEIVIIKLLFEFSFLFPSLTDERLRIAFGVVAGLLGLSVIALLSIFVCLQRKRRRHQSKDKKSLSTSYDSSTSSLYISPHQRPDTFPPSIATIYQLATNDEAKNKTFNRTDSFRQAVLSGNRQNQIIERVSTNRDSYIYPKDDWSPTTITKLEHIIPAMKNQNRLIDLNKTTNNIYHIIVPSTSSNSHVV